MNNMSFAKNRVFFSLAFMCLALLNACSESDEFEKLVPNADRIELGAYIPMNSKTSRVVDNCFENNDVMGTFIVDYSDNHSGVLLPSGNRANNLKYEFDAVNNKWIAAADVFWKDKSTPVDIYGYYPYVPEVPSIEHFKWKVAKSQNDLGNDINMGEYEKSDFLWAKAEKISPTDQIIPLKYRHLMASVVVVLEKGEGFSDEEWKGLEPVVSIKNTSIQAEVNLSKGTVLPVSGSKETIISFPTNRDFRAVVVPQQVAKGQSLVNVTIDGSSYDLIKKMDMVYASGKMHKFTIQVNRRTSKGDFEFSLVDENISEWIDDFDTHNGIITGYVIVDVEKGGTLKQRLQEMGKNADLIRNLKVTGHLNDSDFIFIREDLIRLSHLNLKDVILVDKEGLPNYTLPYSALEGSRVNHVVFPDSLLEIKGHAFYNVQFNERLRLPEGLKKLGWGVFSCTKIQGDIIIPNSVEVIDEKAFNSCTSNGRLFLSHNLRYIGNEAFREANLVGRLILPPNLQYIGDYAFMANNFTGDLIIPQGIKKIGYKAFQCWNHHGFQGVLELPEGVEDISDHAFDHCQFRGVLKLPETLKRIGTHAFEYNHISSVIIPDGVSVIEKGAFHGCSYLLGTLKLPKEMTVCQEDAFRYCQQLDEVVIPEHVKMIAPNAFASCSNLTKVRCKSVEPPFLAENSFSSINLDNVTLQVPYGTERAYQNTKNWNAFKRLSSDLGFVCRPQKVCAMNDARKQSMLLDAEDDWEIIHKPDWCAISPESGSSKTALNLEIAPLQQGQGNRNDSIVFRLKGTEFVTQCEIEQYDYKYHEDECVTLQKATKGEGIDLIFLGDGFDAKSISENQFLDIINKQIDYFFDLEPFRSYREYFNVYACFALSQENGINTLYTKTNTKFGTIYTEGTLWVKENSVFDYLSKNTPVSKEKLCESLIVVVPNTVEYQGTTVLYEDGSAISICPPSDDADNMRITIQREAGGFGFGKLGDEDVQINRFVSSPEQGKIRKGHSLGWFKNLALTNDMKAIPWSHFVFDPRYSNHVDVFEGGAKYTRGVYRSEQNSCMTNGIPYYNAISRQEIMKRILEYSGEGFTMEKFYATDSQEWGKSEKDVRSASFGKGCAVMSHSPRIINERPSKK